MRHVEVQVAIAALAALAISGCTSMGHGSSRDEAATPAVVNGREITVGAVSGCDGNAYLDVVNPGGASGQVYTSVGGQKSYVADFYPSTTRIDLTDWRKTTGGNPMAVLFVAMNNPVPATSGALVPGPNGTMVPAPPPAYPRVTVRAMCEARGYESTRVRD